MFWTPPVNCATRPPYRRQRLYSALLGYMAAVLHDEGARRAWIGANADNRASLRGFANAGGDDALVVGGIAELGDSCTHLGTQHPDLDGVAAFTFRNVDPRHAAILRGDGFSLPA